MKIVYYTDQIYLHGGLERVLSNKLNYMSLHTDIELHVITFQQKENTPCYSIEKKVVFHDLNINYKRDLSFLNPKNFVKAYDHYSKLKKTINNIAPDVIVVCNYEFGFYFVPLIAPKKILIKEFHSSRYYYELDRKKNTSFHKKIMYKLVDYFQSKYNHLVLLNKDELKFYKPNNKIVIPNALTSSPTNISNLEKNRVISAGRIAPVKGFEKLISIWEIVSKYHPNWILDIYGDGEATYVKELEKQIHKKGLSGKVNLKGATQDLKNEMTNSSIYAMTSITECFPMVLLEAMSCGIPVVSFDSPTGPRNIINNNIDGILVDYDNNQAFANEIINLIENPDLKKNMGKNAYNNVKRFTENNIMPKWLKIFGYNIVN